MRLKTKYYLYIFKGDWVLLSNYDTKQKAMDQIVFMGIKGDHFRIDEIIEVE